MNKREFFIVIIVVPLVTAPLIALIGILSFIFADDNGIYEYLLTPISIVVFLISLFFYNLLKNDYKAKYYFLGKKYKQSIANSIAKFKSADREFITEYIKLAKGRYRTYGSIELTKPYYFDETVYKRKETLPKIKLVYQMLLDSIENGTFFQGFFSKINTEEIESVYMAYEYLQIELLSNELRYLIIEVYKDTGFNFNDNGLSQSFTEKTLKAIERTNTVYNPILLSFKKELQTAIQKLTELENK